jgi:hypothetical protein
MRTRQADEMRSYMMPRGAAYECIIYKCYEHKLSTKMYDL